MLRLQALGEGPSWLLPPYGGPTVPWLVAHHSSLPLCLHTAFVLVSVSFSVSCKAILIGCRAQPNPCDLISILA